MATDLVINATSYEHRVALVENGQTVEFYVERRIDRGQVGNIYKGRVVRVLPGMQAAFVDIGLERTAFLYVDDVCFPVADLEALMLRNDFDGACCGASHEMPLRRVPGTNIDDLLTEGQDILVQVCKEPLGTKGARLTCHISLPGRNLVLMPTTNHVGVSRRIDNDDVRQFLRETIETLRPPGIGFIARTVAETATLPKLETEMEFLLSLWQDIQERGARAPVPSLVHEDLDITLRAVRDLFSHEVDRLVVDDGATCDRILQFVDHVTPRLRSKVYRYEGELPIFDAYGIEMDINRALAKKVWLKSGGYIVIEMTEALTVIDVNTGRYVGKTDLEETIFKTNMEAVKEIAYQLRLRNVGGIIIIDFIDMEEELHRDELLRSLNEEVKKDKSRINILKISEFGLVQMTRKRSRDALARQLCEPCFYCDGEGFLKGRSTLCFEILRRIRREVGSQPDRHTVYIRVHPRVADVMLKEEGQAVAELEQEIGRRVVIEPCKELHLERYEIIWD
ncbi:MAG: Rne/Rng family ribonuclease [Thermodesulfobacteriota bacterium]